MDKADKIIDIATKRGFFFPTAEIYNSRAGFWTYGHLGKILKNKFEDAWRKYFLSLHPYFFEIEGSSILPEKVFEASGHLKNFKDPSLECGYCHTQFKIEDILPDIETKIVEKKEELLEMLKKKKCPKCLKPFNEKTMVQSLNLMFEIKIGSVGKETGYLSPETAQNPYLSFKREYTALREKLPFGLAMIGKAFRNEISPRQGFFRLREFTQAELQIFFDPDDIEKSENWEKIKNKKVFILRAKNKKEEEISLEKLHKDSKIPLMYLSYLDAIHIYYTDILKIEHKKIRFRELGQNERAFYNKIHFDVELNLESLDGWKEVAGLHYRGDYDLRNHQQHSKEKLEILKGNKRFIPHVLELSFGVDRNIWALLDLFFKEEKERTVFQFPPLLSPFDCAIFPLVNKDGLPEKAQEIYDNVKREFMVFYDSTGSIGRMYRRVDEIGVPCMVTIDHETLKDNTITLRDRNSMKQVRVPVGTLNETIKKFLSGSELSTLGKIVK